MNFNVSIGQYYPTDSYIHKLDPRVKLLATFNFIIVVFIASNLLSYFFIFSFLILIIVLSKVPIMYIINGLKGIIFLVLFTILLNIFFVQGEREIFSLWIIKVTVEGLIAAIKMGFRLTMLIISSFLLTLTTSPIQLTNGIEHSLRFLKKLKVPVHEISMMITISLRFIPTLMEEADKIMKAQKSRGANFDTGNIIKRAKSLIPVLIPLFINSFRRADELAMAMESRCYRGDIDRSRMKILKYQIIDYKAILILTVFTLLVVFISLNSI